ncbi:hypothetical protein P9112_014025 [Eukaryota sp. TZLM1-RC]
MSDLLASLTSQLSSLDSLTSQSKKRSEAFLRNYRSSSSTPILPSSTTSAYSQRRKSKTPSPKPPSVKSPLPKNNQPLPKTVTNNDVGKDETYPRNDHPKPSLPSTPSSAPALTSPKSRIMSPNPNPKHQSTSLVLLNEPKINPEYELDLGGINQADYCSHCYSVSERVDLITFLYKLKNHFDSESQCLRAITLALSDNKILVLWRSELRSDLPMFVKSVVSLVDSS